MRLFSALVAAAALATIVMPSPKADLHLEVARTPSQREYGLMNRTSVPAHTGMIFVFDSDAPIGFWMKNTLVPLDMIFVAADGTVRQVYANVPVVSPRLPDDKIPIEGPVQAKYVIELHAGEAAQDGIAPGVKLPVDGVPPSLP